MNFTYFFFHRALWACLLTSVGLVFSGLLWVGQVKLTQNIDLFDALGEGGITLMTLIWIFFILLSRPSGRVTNWLFFGLLLTHISQLMDFLDEFLVYPAQHAWLSAIESLPAPIGMVIMSVALFYWHQEQPAINNQLRRTERFYREHSLNDFVTGLYSADYMKNQIKREINNAKKLSTGFALVMCDIRRFTQINQQYGYQNGDTLLREVAQIILMNVRDGDLACRYASDRFIILMPHTEQETADEISKQIRTAINHLAYKYDNTSRAIYPDVTTCSHHYRGWQSYEAVLQNINEQLNDAKTQHGDKVPA